MDIKIVTNRLIVRPLLASDYKSWKSAHKSCLEVKNIWDHSVLSDEELSKSHFLKDIRFRNSERKADRTYIYSIFTKTTGEYLGDITIMNIIRGKLQTGTLGITLLNNHWGIGLGKEIGAALPKLAFRQLGLHRVEGNIEAANKRSIALAKAVGLKREGVKKKAALLRGKWVDLVLFAATAENFGINWRRRDS